MIKKILIKARERLYDVVLRHYYFSQYVARKRKYVVLGDSMVGIGNRIIALANTYSWHGKDNITLVWACDLWVPIAFERLFYMADAPGFCTISSRRKKWSRYIQLPSFSFTTTKWWQFWVPPAYASDLPNGNIFCLYNATPAWAYKVYQPFFSQLQPSDEVKERLKGVVLPEDVVCVQIRNSFHKIDAPGVASIDSFIKEMNKSSARSKFFLSCMHKEISDKVRLVFGDRIIELPNKDYKSMVDAVADMWLLGSGKELICQKGSTFAEVAWWWRGCRAKVTAIEREYYQNR